MRIAVPTVTKPYMNQGPLRQGIRLVSKAGIIRKPIPIIMVITNPTPSMCLVGPARDEYPLSVAQARAKAMMRQK
jgi:hypothetical protein